MKTILSIKAGKEAHCFDWLEGIRPDIITVEAAIVPTATRGAPSTERVASSVDSMDHLAKWTTHPAARRAVQSPVIAKMHRQAAAISHCPRYSARNQNQRQVQVRMSAQEILRRATALQSRVRPGALSLVQLLDLPSRQVPNQNP